MANGEGAAATSGAVSGLQGGIFGAVAGGIGGFLGAVEERRAAKRVRRRTRKAVQSARQFAEQRVAEITGEGSLFRLGEDFLRSTFENTAESPLAQDFAKQIRSQQASRGLFTGNLAAQQEAFATSAFSQRLRAQLQPQLTATAFAPEQLRQDIVRTRTPFEIQAAIGGGFGPGIFSSAFQGAAGGFQIGQSFGQTQQELETEDLKQQRLRQQIERNQPRQQQQSSEQFAFSSSLGLFGRGVA